MHVHLFLCTQYHYLYISSLSRRDTLVLLALRIVYHFSWIVLFISNRFPVFLLYQFLFYLTESLESLGYILISVVSTVSWNKLLQTCTLEYLVDSNRRYMIQPREIFYSHLFLSSLSTVFIPYLFSLILSESSISMYIHDSIVIDTNIRNSC